MNRSHRWRDRQNFTEGVFIGNASGDHSTVGNVTVGNVTYTSAGAAGAAALDELREVVASLRAEVEALDDNEPTRVAAQYELVQLAEELGKEEPDDETVRVSGKRLQRLLGLLQHAGGIAQFTERMVTLIRALFGGG